MDKEKISKIEEVQDDMLLNLLKDAESRGNDVGVKQLKEVLGIDNIDDVIKAEKSDVRKTKPKENALSDNYIIENNPDEADFDVDDMEDIDVPFDLIPIPSKGLVYKNGKAKIPVAYLNASDEDLITSPNLYVDGRLIDLILKRKILDKNIKVNSLCKGDRDAIIVWLRASGYGELFPVKVKDPLSGEVFQSDVNLSEIKFNEFKLKPDKDGLFDFVLPRSKSLVKFRFMSYNEELSYAKVLEKSNVKVKKHVLSASKDHMVSVIDDDSSLSQDIKASFENAILSIDKYIDSLDDDGSDYIKGVTYILQKTIVSIDGVTDKKFIAKYISVMPAMDSKSLRDYINENAPSLDYTVNVNRPESLGGGSFKTFLELDSSVFINVS